jgi:hypothetical protein
MPTIAKDHAVDWTEQLVEQLGWHWTNHLRPRLDGLTDDEYLWEPVPGAWSIRPRSEARTEFAAGFGVGDYVADFEFPDPVPAPVTTIAWRMGHVSVGVFGARAAAHFGAPPLDYETVEWQPTAAGGLAMLDASYDAWIAGVRSLDTAALARPVGDLEPYPDAPMAELVLHINREAIHHGAEIALLRDLYGQRVSRE